MHTDDATQTAPAGSHAGAVAGLAWRGPGAWALYWGAWFLIGLSLALAQAQDPSRPLGQRAWEPFLYEITSALATGVLALPVVHVMARLATRRRRWEAWVAMHVAGAVLFCVAHVALMYAMRWPLYFALTSRSYAPMSPLQAILFEGAKDLVTYAAIVAVGYALLLRQRQAAQRLHLARTEAAVARLELARVSNQLQPHYLFNCLNAVSGLVEEDPKKAVTMIARVGRFLREAMDVEAEPIITLGRELELSRHYLDTQALRFEGRLQLHFDVPEELKHLAVPRLVLQPLLENAVKHGMVMPGEPLQVRTAARRARDRLLLQVRNAGHGPGSARGAAVSPAAPADGGFGLDLVRRRLELQYGDDASLHARRAEDGAFEVTIDLPLREAWP